MERDNKEIRAELDEIKATQEDLSALISLSQLYGKYLPWSRSALRPAAARFLVNSIVINRINSVVEFGTGISSVLIARALELSGGTLVTIDHDANWQSLVAEWMSAEMKSRVTFVNAQLKENGKSASLPKWYDESIVKDALRHIGPAGLVVVDGPPGYRHEEMLSRLPALEAVRPYLSKDSLIVLDDVDRPGEQLIANKWSELLCKWNRRDFRSLGITVWQSGKMYNSI